ncbi:uncharacterized protein LOC120415348 [Culex pipiens pallens]|uniref:uncharacterized protein LOC120415348 n=1 Tax=Culex pipiens pallens TaxID=42434 RepID=UPI0019540889|nr:uncharacterized protein LOC120415348 [Culex pipiens pallens]
MDYRCRMLWMLLGVLLIHQTSAQFNMQLCLSCAGGETSCNDERIGAFSCPNASDHCYVRNINGRIDRGCLQNLTNEAERSPCLNEADSSCLTCSGLVCNRALWPTCHVCQESTDDATCRDGQPGAGAFCGRFSEESGCFERIVNGRVERGCRSDLGEDPCDGNEHCRVCEGSDCNRDAAREFQVTKCVQCKADGTDEDGSCLSGSIAPTNCGGPSDEKCYSRILPGGILERGCQASLTQDEVQNCNGTKCNICQGDGCNRGIFPVDRLTCNQCKSNNSTDCGLGLTDESKTVVCKIFKEHNRCYSRFGPDDHFERGCEADMGLQANACDNVRDCMVCAGKNCNTIAAAQLEQLPKCQRCSSADDHNCDEGSVTPTICGDHLEDACFTRIENGVLERNCLSTLGEAEKAKCDDPADTSCHKCSGQGCNQQEWLKCYQCNSATDKSCSAEQRDNHHSAYCRHQHDEDHCYTRIVDNILERGCQSDLGEDVDACDDLDDMHCEACDDASCNGISQSKLRNAAANLAGNLVLMVTAAVAVAVRMV